MQEVMTIQKTELLGTNLRSRDFRTGSVFFETFKPKLEYKWDTGIAIGRFLTEIKKGRLVGSYCSQCKRTLIPPRIFCELCFRDIDKWVSLKDTGTIQTFSICFITWDMKRLVKPQIPAVIAIDGASPGYGVIPPPDHLGKLGQNFLSTPGGWTGGGIMHLLKAKDWKTLKVGDKVKAVWKPKNQRKGAITDIKYFEVLK